MRHHILKISITILILAITILILAITGVVVGSSAAQEDSPKPRLYIETSTSWEVSGSAGSADGTGGGGVRGGARGQTAELIKTFNKRCPAFTITNKKDRADYTLTFDHEGGKQVWEKDNKFAIFNKDGDAVESGSARSLGSAVKTACAALMSDWKTNGPQGP
jgi:Archaeal Type IV pilin, N-terminal